MSSRYVRESVSNDMETYGHIETDCATVEEFVREMVKSDEHYQFIFGKPTSLFGKWRVSCEAVLVIRNREVINDKGYEAVKTAKIDSVTYRDGWGGVEFNVTLE